ncbi:MAG: hypothetical protein LV479_09775 [Methylacidiphilales bacterium]|nr:hypothetical protein [Candidatus Methylacidiphilales bacterium]
MKTSQLLKITRETLIGLGAGILLLGASGFLQAETVTMYLPEGNYATHIGTRTISDPSGATHTKKEVAGKVVVAIFSAPNMSQGGRQEKWSDLLANQPATKLSDDVALFLVEDMSQAGMFKGMALDQMKKEFTPKSRPFLILDQDGSVLKRFGVPRGSTQILIYDKNGTLRDVETDLDNQDKTIYRLKSITKRLLAE